MHRVDGLEMARLVNKEQLMQLDIRDIVAVMAEPVEPVAPEPEPESVHQVEQEVLLPVIMPEYGENRLMVEVILLMV